MATEKPGFRPVHPGVIVKRNLEALGVSVEEFADRIDVTRQNVYAILRGERAVSADMAARLARAFRTSSQFWLNMQAQHDVWEPERSLSIRRIRPFRWAAGKINAPGATKALVRSSPRAAAKFREGSAATTPRRTAASAQRRKK